MPNPTEYLTSEEVATRPILFSGPMVQALLTARKTQTRRICKEAIDMDGQTAFAVCPAAESGWIAWFGQPDPNIAEFTKKAYKNGFPCPYGKPGERLWVRETWKENIPPSGWIYRATDESSLDPRDSRPWRPSIFMPRSASRITLEIVSVRVERLQDISGKDILAEGAVLRAHDDQFGHNPISAFDGACYMDLKSLWATGWDSINKKRGFGWDVNPWVWVIEFRRANA